MYRGAIVLVLGLAAGLLPGNASATPVGAVAPERPVVAVMGPTARGAGEVLAQAAGDMDWWVQHNSCAVALGRAWISSPQWLPVDGYGIGVEDLLYPISGTTRIGRSLEPPAFPLPSFGFQTLGGTGFASATETMANWDRLGSLLQEVRVRRPPAQFDSIYVSYIGAIAGMWSAAGFINEGRMDTAPNVVAALDFARNFNRLEAIWPARPRVDLADCSRFWQ